MTSSARLRLLLLFFVSGISGLVYQVIWIRELGYVFGNNVYSAALVTAVFMAGLGLGGLGAGHLADRWHARTPSRLVRGYAICELFIASVGMGLALLLPLLDALSATTLTYVTDAAGWHHPSVGTYVWLGLVTVLLVFPSTLAMGATLTLLIRALIPEDLEGAGWQVALLYGANTAGAACGALLTDVMLVPALGLFGAQSIAVVLNMVAGFGALRFVPDAIARRQTGDLPRTPDAAPIPEDEVRRVRFTTAAVAFAGFAGMGMEILWFRYLTSLLGAYRVVLSLLLAVILVGIWAGAIGAGALHRRLGRAPLLFAGAQAGFLLTALALLALVDQSAVNWTARGHDISAVREVLFNLEPIVWVVMVPALLMGAAFPLANGHIQSTAGRVGRRAGGLYVANTAGAVLGATATGFLLLPNLGMQRTILVLGASSLFAALAFVLPGPRDPRSWGAIGAMALALLGWSQLDADRLIRQQFPDPGKGEYIHLHEGVHESIGIAESRGSRTLYTNGHAMSATVKPAQRYMRAFSHIPLLHADAPENVLVICFGVGNTSHAASLHPSVKRIDVADLSQDILQSAPYFERWNHNVLEDPRVHVHVVDGRQHLRVEGPDYDLITLEPPPIAFAGVSSLYSRDFYTLARERLTEDGWMTQWLPIYQLPPEAALSLVRAFVDVFPNAILLSGWRNELILMGAKTEHPTIDPADLARRLSARPKVQADLRNVSMGTVEDILGSFAGSADTLRAATAHVPPVTDDWPILEYAVVSGLERHSLPPDLFSTAGIETWCPSCGAKPSAALEAYLEHMDRYYDSKPFLGGSTESPVGLGCKTATVAALRRESLYFDHVSGCAGQ